MKKRKIRNFGKRTMSLMLALMMCFSLIQTTALAAPGPTTPEEVDTVSNGDIVMKMIDFAPTNNSTYLVSTMGGGWDSGYITQGLLSRTLDSEGYPSLLKGTGVGDSLGDYFDVISSGLSVNHLFLDSVYDDSGTYYFNSMENFADLDTVTGRFTVYKALVTPQNSSNSLYTCGNFLPYNAIGDTLSNYDNSYSPSGINPDAYDGDDLYLPAGFVSNSSSNVDFNFGLYLSADFAQLADGQYNGDDMVFNFSGDDDMWIYIDGVLVLDLGGIHSAQDGSINFATGEVAYTGARSGNSTSIYDQFNAAGVDLSGFTEQSSDGIFEDYTTHTITMFYLERGAGASDLMLSFNLPVVPQNSVNVYKAFDLDGDSTSEAPDGFDATFELYDSDHNLVESADYSDFDDNGHFSFEDVTPGDYTVEEVLGDTPDGYTYQGTTVGTGTEDTLVANVTVPEDGSADVTFVNSYETIQTYHVTYEFDGDYPSSVTLPTDSTDYYSGDLVTVADDYSDVAGTHGTWSFDGWDTDDFYLTGDTTITGSWTFTADPTYNVTYQFSGSYPDSVTLPTDSTDYYSGDLVTVADDYSDVAGTHGTWSFDGWDTDDFYLTGDTTITGSWTFTADPTYNVTYQFSGSYPDSVTLPTDSTDYYSGDLVTVADDYSDVAGTHGTWSFDGWDTDDFYLTGDTTITGSWTFTADPTYNVTYQFSGSYPDSVTLPTDSTDYYSGDLVTVADDYSDVAGTHGTWSFDGWDTDDFYLTGDTTITGSWTFTAEGQYTVLYTDGAGNYYPNASGTSYYTSDSYTVLSNSTTGFSKSNYSFDGWTVNIEGKPTTVGASGTGTSEQAIVYTATWERDSNPSTYYKLTIKWIGDEGNSLASPVVKSLKEGTSYNTDNYEGGSGRTFTGYTYDFTIGDETGTMDGATTVTFVYTAVPLAELDTYDHYAYIIGRDDGLVHPEANITRAEVATIFFRLLTDEARDLNLSTQNDFSDVSSTDWYNTAISTLSSMGIINGYPDGTFGPDNNITRAEFAAIAARFDSSEFEGESSFTDTDGHWAENEINRAAAYGWINGYTDGTFKPDNDITRAESVTLINRVLGRQPEAASDLLSNMVTWPDNLDTGAWYYLAIQEATNSHYFDIKVDSIYETWTELRENRDWTTFEKH